MKFIYLIKLIQNQENLNAEQAAAAGGEDDDDDGDVLALRKKKKKKSANRDAAGTTGEGDAQVVD